MGDHSGTKASEELKQARRQASEYAMAFDLLSRITHSCSEKEAVESILEIFEILFVPRRVTYVSLRDGRAEDVYSSVPLEEDAETVKARLAGLDPKHTWAASGKGFQVKINCSGSALGILEVEEIAFPQYIEYYLNLTISMVKVCGLAIENAKRYQLIKDAEKRLKDEKGKLEEALSKVKKLSGLLPICGHCKKIRDDKGYWNQIEAYVEEHSDAEFSHGICRECALKYYPDLDIYDD